ncbi:MAG TPA: divalent-cation tolerance protein CutA [Blastocatellia bacterium]|jgi:periplasmic divalent cation tolerance protein
MSDELIILVTAPNRGEAARIARSLVSERLAACVNIIAEIESVYRWEGKVIEDSESLMIVKTTEDRYSAVESRVRELHTYTVPEVIALRIEQGSEAYLRWIHECTRSGHDSMKSLEEEERNTKDSE